MIQVSVLSVIHRYTRLASCDIWGTKEVDFLGLDDFSSPYQDEEVISRTPTLAQLNSEDSQPVCETLNPLAELTLPPPQPQTQLSQLPCHSKRSVVPGSGPGSARASSSFTASSRPSRNLLPDFPEDAQKATRPVPSSTETMAKAQNHSQVQIKIAGRGTKTALLTSHGPDFVRKAKVRVTPVQKPLPILPPQPDFERPEPPLPISQPQDEKASTSANSTLVDLPGAAPEELSNLTRFERAEETAPRDMAAGWSPTVPQLVETGPVLDDSTSVLVSVAETGAGASGGGGGGVLVVEGAEKTKEEEHNYSLFLTRSRQSGKVQPQLEEDEEEEDEEEAEEEEEGDGIELDDEDHDEGFGSEHELSENEEEEEEDDDYEADKDDDMSDAFSEPGRNHL